MTENLFLHPEIFFHGHPAGPDIPGLRPEAPGAKINAFFTGKMPGVDREAVCRELGTSPENLFMPVQKHTNEVIVYEEFLTESGIKNPPEADAVITAKAGVALGIMVADCVPVLLHDEKRGVIGAVHAGWRGTAKAILANAIWKMRSSFGSHPADILLAIGPAIRKCCYEVDIDVLRQIEASTSPKNEKKVKQADVLFYWMKGPKAYIDLPEANRQQALACGLKTENIWLSGMCTSCLPEKFNSYRREFRLGAKAPGRQGGFIIKHS